MVHGPVESLEEAAAARGVTPAQVIKTMVVRRSEEDYVFVLVPGDRVISWPKLRRHLGESRLSMPDADDAHRVTGYARGMITPFGSIRRLPVLADEHITGQVSIGGGAHGVSLKIRADHLLEVLAAEVADITESV
ncbi:MAG TPA: YbaK/EbsC family protein [Acidimicrobiia bacterium]|nr:YbaK/EbsC family protein [Acidimicrobiia bacterium]